LALLFLAQVCINLSVTHKPLLLPYQLHEETYGVSPLLLWQPFKPEPVYRHEVMRRYHVEEEPPPYLHHRTPQVLVAVSMEKVQRLLQLLFFSPALAGSVLLLPLVLTRDKRVRIVVAMALAFMGALLLEVWMLPHYITPILPALFLLGIQGLRRMRVWRLRGRAIGLYAMRCLVALALCSPLSSYVAIARPNGEGLVFSQPGQLRFGARRAQLQRELEAMPGKHLVIVRYRKTHDASEEWVYNRADIDAAKVVWARAMTPQQDSALMKYFARRHRRIWMLDADAPTPHLQAFSAEKWPANFLPKNIFEK
jgi:4-amino-4-deoxy-L-arabinose transferase-like glycosyltransferase